MKYLMKYNDYQEFTRTTAQYPKEDAFLYTQLGFIGEVGEVANKYKKVIRGDYELEDIKSELIKEVGDLIWYYARHMDELGYKLEPLLQHNNGNRYRLTYNKVVFTACLDNLIFNFICGDYEETGSQLYLLADLLNTTLEEVMVINKAKLEDRLNRNVIKGTGDDR